MLNERGPVLIDFGIAHPEDATQLTATGLVTGSPAWLSPEQANLEQTGPATDVFTRLFSNDNPVLRLARGVGMAAVNRIGPARRFFMEDAGGATGDLPRLLRGEAL